jgi:hypothetical protein
MGDEAAGQRSRACLRASWAQPIPILRLLIEEADPVPSFPKRVQSLSLKIRGTKGVMNNGIRNSTLPRLRLHHRARPGAEPRHLLLLPMLAFRPRASDIKAGCGGT